MDPDLNQLNIVDEQGNVIGQATRPVIHRDGLLHKEVHVWFYTPEGNVIFQHRAKDKDTFPDLLDVTVGGHVEIGSDYEDSALTEVEEETGLKLNLTDLKFLKIVNRRSFDNITHTINHALRAIYLYEFKGDAKDLKVEAGKSQGFEVWPLEKLLNLSTEDNARFIPYVGSDEGQFVLNEIKKKFK